MDTHLPHPYQDKKGGTECPAIIVTLGSMGGTSGTKLKHSGVDCARDAITDLNGQKWEFVSTKKVSPEPNINDKKGQLMLLLLLNGWKKASGVYLFLLHAALTDWMPRAEAADDPESDDDSATKTTSVESFEDSTSWSPPQRLYPSNSGILVFQDVSPDSDGYISDVWTSDLEMIDNTAVAELPTRTMRPKSPETECDPAQKRRKYRHKIVAKGTVKKSRSIRHKHAQEAHRRAPTTPGPVKRGTIERVIKRKRDEPEQTRQKAATFNQLKERVQRETDRIERDRSGGAVGSSPNSHLVVLGIPITIPGRNQGVSSIMLNGAPVAVPIAPPPMEVAHLFVQHISVLNATSPGRATDTVDANTDVANTSNAVDIVDLVTDSESTSNYNVTEAMC